MTINYLISHVICPTLINKCYLLKIAKPHVYIIKLHIARKREYTVSEVRDASPMKLNMHDLSFLYNRIFNHSCIWERRALVVNIYLILMPPLSEDIRYTKITYFEQIMKTFLLKMFTVIYDSKFFTPVI